MEFAQTGICEVDLHSQRFSVVNELMCKHLGYSKEELLAQKPFDILDEDSVAQILQHVKKQKPQDPPFFVDLKIKKKSGDWLMASLSAIVAFEDDKPQKAIFIDREIAENQKIKNALFKSEGKFKTIFDAAPIPIAVLGLDGTFLELNQAAVKMQGAVSAEELIGMNCLAFIDESFREKGKQALQEVVHKPIVLREFRLRRYDGRVAPTLVSAVALQNEHGEPYAISTMSLDITEKKKNEEELLRRSIILDQVQDAVIGTDADINIIYWAKGAERIYGYTEAEARGKKIHDLLQVNYGPDEYKNLGKTLERNGKTKAILNARHKNGTRIISEVIINRNTDVNGKFNGYVSVARDITKRVEIEETFHQREEQYRLATRAAKMLSWELKIGTGILQSPEPFEPYLGLIPDTFAGTIDSFQDYVYPEDLPRLRKALSRSIEKGKDLDIEHRVVWPNGSIHWLRHIGAVLLDDDGRPNRLLGILTDITGEKNLEQERHRLSRELHSEKDMLDVLMEHTHAHLAYLDRNFTFLKVNTAYANGCGRTKEDLIGKRHFDLFPDPETKKIFIRVLRTGKPVSFMDKPFLLGSDPRRALTYWNWTLEPIKSRDDKVVGLVLSLVDITDLKMHQKEIQKLNHNLIQYAAELKAANAELEAFCYSVSHDLRAPLRSMNGFSQALLEDYPDKLDDEGKDYLHRIHKSTEKMSQLIDDLLKLSRLTRRDMLYEEVDLGLLARDIINNLKKTNPDRNVKLKLQDKLIVNGDENLLRMALENLLGNAWKFTKTRDKALIEVGKRRQNDEFIYYIKDNGAGFDMKYSDKLFIPFQRLHSDKQFEGTGIGLGIVKRIITRHGGRVWAEAEENKGATFYFTLPTAGYTPS